MFIRWITRLNVTPDADGRQDTAYSLVLAESRRVKGKPKQRHIAYLGGINDHGIKQPSHRCEFWHQVTAAFDRLGNQVMPEDRKRFETAIAAKVPRPTAKQRNAYVREQAKWEQAKREREKLEEALRPWRGNLPMIAQILKQHTPEQ
jgi:hypothetical protein